MCTYVCSVSECVCLYVCMCTCVYVCVCGTCVYVYVCVYCSCHTSYMHFVIHSPRFFASTLCVKVRKTSKNLTTCAVGTPLWDIFETHYVVCMLAGSHHSF
jgi:hypothetical protein